MEYRFKTREELIREFGVDFIYKGVSFNDEMVDMLGSDVPNEYITTVNLSDVNDRFFYNGWTWQVWMITPKISPKELLFSESFYNIISMYGSDISESLSKLKYEKRTKDDIKNITINKQGLLTYCPANQESSLSSSGTWIKKGRQEGRIGRLLSKICKEFSIDYTDSDMEKLVNFIKAMASGGEFKIIEGENIRNYYSENAHQKSKGTGSLENSCMRHDKCQDYFEIYVQNPDVCKMLILVEANQKIIGRALIWKSEQGTFMDRVYGSDSTITKFIEYAKENKYLHKYKQNHDSARYISKDDDVVEMEIRVKLDKFKFDFYPYLDTLYHLSEDGVLSNYDANASYAQLRETDGSFVKTRKCFVDGMIYEAINCVQVENEEGNLVWVNHDNLLMCNMDGKYYLKSMMVETNSRGWIYKSKNIDNIEWLESEGRWEFKDNVFICAHDGIKYSKSNRARWSSSSKMVVIKYKGDELTIHSNNLETYLISVGYKVVDKAFISPSLAKELKLKTK